MSQPAGPKPASSLAGFAPTLASGLIVRGLAAVRTMLLAPLLGPEGLGLFRMAQTATQIAVTIGSLGIPQAFPRYLPELPHDGARRAFVRSLAPVAAAGVVVLALLALVLPRAGAALVFADAKYAGLMACVAALLPVTLLFRSATAVSIGMGRFRVTAEAETMQGVGFFALGLGALWIWRGNVVALLVPFAATTLVAGVIAGWRLSLADRADAAPAPAELRRRALAFAGWYMLIPISQNLFEFIDRWLVARAISMEVSGSYAFVSQLTGAMFLIAASLGAVVLRRASELYGRGERDAAHAFVCSCTTLVALVSLGYAITLRLLEPVVWRLFGLDWAQAREVLPVLLAYQMAFNVMWLLATLSSLREALWVQLAAGLAGNAANAAVGVLLVPAMGALGAAAGTLGGLAVMLAIHLAFGWRAGALRGLSPLALALPLAAMLPLPALAGIGVVTLALACVPHGGVLGDAERALVMDYARGLLGRRG